MNVHEWHATHTMVTDGGVTRSVMLVDNVAYTLGEWVGDLPGSFSRDRHGWKMNGREFTGTVVGP